VIKMKKKELEKKYIELAKNYKNLIKLMKEIETYDNSQKYSENLNEQNLVFGICEIIFELDNIRKGKEILSENKQTVCTFKLGDKIKKIQFLILKLIGIYLKDGYE